MVHAAGHAVSRAAARTLLPHLARAPALYGGRQRVVQQEAAVDEP